MGCIGVAKVWVVYVWLWYGLCRCGYGMGCVGFYEVWVVYVWLWYGLCRCVLGIWVVCVANVLLAY
jgi:hypothetical protein